MPSVPTVDKSSQSVQAMFSSIAGRYDLLNHLLSANQDVRWRKRAVRLLTPRSGEEILDLCCGTGDLSFEILRRQPRCEVIGGDFAEPMLEIARTKAQGLGVRGWGLGHNTEMPPASLTSTTQATSTNPQPPTPNPHFVTADALHLPFDDAKFNAVTVGFGVRNFENTEAGMREIHRVLQPGGRVLVLEFMRPTSFFLRHVFGLFFKGILPRVGRLISKHNSAYSYLPASVGDFYSRDEFIGLLRQCGFRDVRAFDYNFGGVTCFLAKKSV